MFSQVFSLSLRFCAGGKSEDSGWSVLSVCVHGLKMAPSYGVMEGLEVSVTPLLLLQPLVRPSAVFSVRWDVNACLGNRVGAELKSQGAGSELLAGGCCFEQDVPCVSAQREIERWRTGRARSRENAAGRTWAIVSARKHVRTSENPPFRKHARCISSFPSPLSSLRIKTFAIVAMEHFWLSSETIRFSFIERNNYFWLGFFLITMKTCASISKTGNFISLKKMKKEINSTVQTKKKHHWNIILMMFH